MYHKRQKYEWIKTSFGDDNELFVSYVCKLWYGLGLHLIMHRTIGLYGTPNPNPNPSPFVR